MRRRPDRTGPDQTMKGGVERGGDGVEVMVTGEKRWKTDFIGGEKRCMTGLTA